MTPTGVREPTMRVLVAAAAYFAAVFAVAFGLGALRTALVSPRTGDLVAVMIEVPIMLAVSWVVAGAVLRRGPVAAGAARIAMGIAAFAFLMLAEATFATLAFGQDLPGFVGAMATAPGAVGLAGQIGFALIPWLRGPQARG